MNKFTNFVNKYKEEIVNKWIDFFVYNKEIITEKITKGYKMEISIINADYVGKFKIHFKFSDLSEKTIDFSDFFKNAKNPMTNKYKNEKLFKNYSLQYGDIVWNDYELCFPIWDLYQGKI